jgi:tetratricopeptide (TPR) repeat protein
VRDAANSLARAEVMIAASRYAEAVALVAPVVAAEPDNDHAWCQLAQAHLGLGKPAEALAAADRAVQVNPGGSWPHRLRSLAQARLGETRTAVESAIEACRLQPHHWINHYTLAQTAMNAKTHVHEGGKSGLAIARQASDRARQLEPNEPSVHFISGLVSRAYGEDDAAVAHFERTLALDPEHSSAMNELGRIKLVRGRSGAAAGYFIQAARTSPDERAFGHNVQVAVARAERSVRLLVSWVIYGSWLIAFLDLILWNNRSAGDRITMVVLLVLIVAVVSVAWQIQLRRMPAQARPLFQGRSMLLALAISTSSLAVVVALAEFAPTSFESSAWLMTLAFMLTSRFVAYRILNDGARKRRAQLMASH